MTRPNVDRQAALASLLVLTEHGVPADIQDLLVMGNPKLNIKPGALSAAMAAALVVYRTYAAYDESMAND